MSEVTIKINNRGFGVSCDPGQEQRLTDIGHYADSRLKDIARAGAASNESHLLVLTALVLADEVFDLRDQLEEMKHQLAHLHQRHAQQPQAQAARATYDPEEEAMVTHAIDHLADKIAYMAQRLKKAA